MMEKYPNAYIENATLSRKDKTPNANTGEKSNPAIYVNLKDLKKTKYGSQNSIKIRPIGVIKYTGIQLKKIRTIHAHIYILIATYKI